MAQVRSSFVSANSSNTRRCLERPEARNETAQTNVDKWPSHIVAQKHSDMWPLGRRNLRARGNGQPNGEDRGLPHGVGGVTWNQGDA